MQLPDFDNLPSVEGAPKGCAWGLFDKAGKKDQIGTLNFLTPDVVREAGKEIQLGESVVLNWNLEKPVQPYCREKFEYKIKDLGKELNRPICCHDDVITMNTQGSSQWDGFRHWGIASTGLYYNGTKHNDISRSDFLDIGIHHWSDRGGIVGRGVLVDYAGWADKHGIEIKPATSHVINLKDILAILGENKTELRKGDILIIRSGMIRMYNNCKTDEERNALMCTPNSIGLEASEDTIRWLWNNQLAAVAGDSVAFEAQPFTEKYSLHDYLLVWFGMPIGELWDLEALVEKCKEHNRWTFLVTSSPLNIQGGVASPPNALAIF